MFPESDSSFYLRRIPWQFTFTTDAAGNVNGLTSELEGREVTGSNVSGATPPPAIVAGNTALDIPLTPDEDPPPLKAGVWNIPFEIAAFAHFTA